MDGTPGFDSDHANGSCSAHASPSDSQSVPPLSGAQQQGQGGQQSAGQPSQGLSSKSFSSVPHIRSRITVVCAECKRLKLKCDRRTPCGSCLKRDTVQRCIYSQAAAEKIDVQSLHNRLLVVEGTLAQLTATPQQGLPPVTPFKSSYPTGPTQSGLAGPSSSGQCSSTSYLTRVNTGSVLAGLPCNDRSCLVAGGSGSSVVISLDDTASIWLNELECNPPSDEQVTARPSSVSPYSTAKPGSSSNGGTRVKLEPTPVLLPPNTSSSAPSSSYAHRGLGFSRSGLSFVPPVPYTAFLPSDVSSSTSYGPPTATSQTFTSTFSSVPDNTPVTPSARSDIPQVTSTLLAYLPSPAGIRSKYLTSFEEAIRLHPTLNIRHFERRIEAMLSWNESGSEARSKSELAKEVFFGASASKRASASGKDRSSAPTPTLSFFAATCAAFALGALLSRDSEPAGVDEEAGPRNTPAGLFSLSEQALGFFEKTNSYDIDSVTAMLLQVLYLMHDGHMNVSQGVFPLMGKMVNVARMMGLAIDPDEFPGTYNLFDAETRRRVWWDVYYHDMLVSECMGQQPLISETAFTTKHPAELDDDRFTPSSVNIPSPTWEDNENRTTYFVLRNKLTQLVRGIRRQIVSDLVPDDALDISVEQAATFETDITSFMSEMPSAYKLGQDHDFSQPASTPPALQVIIAQSCVLAIIANRAILKLYLPFLKESSGSKPSHQAVLGTINASHSIIYACRVMHSLWRDSRPVTFDFYDFGRTLFDAAVVCAHAVIQQPGSILAAEALKCVTGAMDVMRVLSVTRVHGESAEAIKIVEMMKEKAERARASGSSDAAAGSKRKRADGEGSREITLTAGFQLPFVGPSVSSAKSDQPRPSFNMSKIATTGPKKDDAKPTKSSKDKEKEKPKYPTVGIRSRTGSSQAPPPSVRQRTNSMAPSPSPVTTSRARAPTTTGVGPPSASPQTQTSSSPDQSSQTSTPTSDPSVSSGYTYPSSTAQSEPMQRDYQMDYNNGTIDGRAFAQSFTSSPQAASGYDQGSNSASYTATSHANPTFRSTPTSDYYNIPSYAGVTPASYEQNRMPSHAQPIQMSNYGLSTPIDSNMGGTLSNSIPGTPQNNQTFMLGPDKATASFEHHIGKSELERQMSHEYQPTATSHGMPMTASQLASTQFVQGWPQAEVPRNQAWDYNKYYGTS